MPQANIISKDEITGGSVCVCKSCRRQFLAGGRHWWYNHLVNSSSKSAIARLLGVSDKAVSKRLNKIKASVV